MGFLSLEKRLLHRSAGEGRVYLANSVTRYLYIVLYFNSPNNFSPCSACTMQLLH
jgi:hypothetical protein